MLCTSSSKEPDGNRTTQITLLQENSNAEMEEHPQAVDQGDERNQVWKCSMCRERFGSVTSLQTHFCEHKGPKLKLSCPLCERLYGTAYSLKRHYLQKRKNKA